MKRTIRILIFMTLGVTLAAVLGMAVKLNAHEGGVYMRKAYGAPLPDFYSIVDGCQSCGHKIVNFLFFYVIIPGSCTMAACSVAVAGEPTKNEADHVQTLPNWLQPESQLYYKQYPRSVSACVNSYKNQIYPAFTKKERITLDQAHQAVASGIKKCRILYDKLYNDHGFHRRKLALFMTYIGLQDFDRRVGLTITVDGRRMPQIEVLHDVFQRVRVGSNNVTGVVTTQMVKDFMDSYDNHTGKDSGN